jgi:mannose-P-dolichol utilization defect protein 1
LFIVAALSSQATKNMDTLVEFMGAPCFKELIVDHNFFHMPCLKMLLSKFLSFGVVAGSMVYKLPQILKIQNNQSAKGVAILGVILELISVTISFAYNYSKGYPFMTFGESAFVAIFNLLIIAQILSFEHGGFGLQGLGGFAIYGAALYALLTGIVPPSVLQILQGCVTPIVIASRLPQIWESYRTKSTGQLSFITWGLNLGGSLARIFTTIQEVDDPLVLVGYLVGATLNIIIIAQMLLYWNNSGAKKPAAGGKKKAKPAQQQKNKNAN